MGIGIVEDNMDERRRRQWYFIWKTPSLFPVELLIMRPKRWSQWISSNNLMRDPTSEVQLWQMKIHCSSEICGYFKITYNLIMGYILGCRMGQYILIKGHSVTLFISNIATQKLIGSGIGNANSACRKQVWVLNIRQWSWEMLTKRAIVSLCAQGGNQWGARLCLFVKPFENLMRG